MNFIITSRSIASKLLFFPFSFPSKSRFVSSSYFIVSPQPRSIHYSIPTTTLWKDNNYHPHRNYTPSEQLTLKSEDPFEQLTLKSEDHFEQLTPQSEFGEIDWPYSGAKKFGEILDCPRPTEIPWQKKVSNLVKLIGRIQAPVQFKEFPDGKCWAATVIAQENSKDSVSLRIPLIFQGNLAHIAACHLKEEDRVYIDGQLSADPQPFTLKCEQSSLQVMVHNVNFVEGSPWKKSFSPRKILDPLESCENDDTHQEKESRDDYQREESVKDSTIQKRESVEELKILDQSFLDLMTKPHEWWDIRLKQVNSASPAFEHKVNGKLVHINESIPDWIKKELKCLTFDRKNKMKSSNGDHASMANSKDLALNSWSDLLKNPKQWLDYRENKLCGSVKPKHPDFKNKDSGASLWLDSAPEWVLSGLHELEFDVPFQKWKNAGDDSWKELVENPEMWWDNRSNKKNPKAPDFKHKDLGTGLWLCNTPAWASSKLPPLKA